MEEGAGGMPGLRARMGCRCLWLGVVLGLCWGCAGVVLGVAVVQAAEVYLNVVNWRVGAFAQV